jgi:glyoxylase-like metal-dependent hydrolase (beta-lactamase superfamily II)/8-oxo-dGTP pyrophosphatase MutT (NUDIX family)
MTTPRRSAAVILHRRTADGLEVFLVERSAKLEFFGGAEAFPGGSVDPGDELLPWSAGAELPGDRDLTGAAARELFEETGILIAAPEPAEEETTAARQAILDGRKDAFRELLESRGLALDPRRLELAARLVTPRFSRIRFDTTFFLSECRGEPSVVPGELSGGGWVEPEAALADWRRGARRIAAPVVSILEAFAGRGLAEAVRELRAMPPEFEGSGRGIPMAPGYEVIPLESPPLPPEIPSNAFLVGTRRFHLIDPAPRGAAGRAHLSAAIERRLARGDRLEAVILTHHHPDHVGALDEIAARFSAPVWAHRRAGELLSRSLDRELADGDRIELGEAPDGSPGWALEVLHTPGHAEDHLAFLDRSTRSLIAGDLLSTIVSMYVGSPGGDLDLYFASLARLKGLGVEVFYPSHGPPGRDLARLVDETLEHRRARIEEVAARLGPEPSTPAAIASAIYGGAEPRLRPLQERAARAALEYLAHHGRARRVGEDAYAPLL